MFKPWDNYLTTAEGEGCCADWACNVLVLCRSQFVQTKTITPKVGLHLDHWPNFPQTGVAGCQNNTGLTCNASLVDHRGYF